MSQEKMTEKFEYYHNPELGICVAVASRDVVTEIFQREMSALTNSIIKKYGINRTEVRFNPIVELTKMSARATCNFEAGDTYSFELAEKISGNRLRTKIIFKIKDMIKNIADDAYDIYNLIEDYNEIVNHRLFHSIDIEDELESKLCESVE